MRSSQRQVTSSSGYELIKRVQADLLVVLILVLIFLGLHWLPPREV